MSDVIEVGLILLGFLLFALYPFRWIAVWVEDHWNASQTRARMAAAAGDRALQRAMQRREDRDS